MIGVPADDGAEQVVAAVVLTPGSRIDQEEVRAWCRTSWAGYAQDECFLTETLSFLAGARAERFFNRIKQFRGIATRYDKDPENFLAAVKFIAARIWCQSL